MKKESKTKWNCISCKKKKGNKTNKSVYSSTPKADINSSKNKMVLTLAEPSTSKDASIHAPSTIMQLESNDESKKYEQTEVLLPESLEFVTTRKKNPY